ncbi:hypothetical protein [Nocardia sp. NPDC127526]|uniref:hypothetical protein n=1 Tax=Nocardia sp. NPDC127526 TaxID=3345393 RepID=UPI003636B284
MPAFAAITPDALLDLLAQRAADLPGHAVIAVDGADAADPLSVARAVADLLRAAGRPADIVSLHDFVRPASLRYEHGHADELSYRTLWFDYAGLDREVLQALREHDRWLPALWNERTDRSARARIRPAAAGTVLLVAGPMLLGRGLTFDLTVGLRMSEAALRRGTDPDEQFTLAALREHHAQAGEPDLTVAWDHPDRPAVRVG